MNIHESVWYIFCTAISEHNTMKLCLFVEHKDYIWQIHAGISAIPVMTFGTNCRVPQYSFSKYLYRCISLHILMSKIHQQHLEHLLGNAINWFGFFNTEITCVCIAVSETMKM